mmetsp:Transcript_9391/g.27909  ORF Transcript_9391/g.27909 Transcript_9391/m.27909 type:complete len:259 (+) Transcript_9391:418-1194(+)
MADVDVPRVLLEEQNTILNLVDVEDLLPNVERLGSVLPLDQAGVGLILRTSILVCEALAIRALLEPPPDAIRRVQQPNVFLVLRVEVLLVAFQRGLRDRIRTVRRLLNGEDVGKSQGDEDPVIARRWPSPEDHVLDLLRLVIGKVAEDLALVHLRHALFSLRTRIRCLGRAWCSRCPRLSRRVALIVRAEQRPLVDLRDLVLALGTKELLLVDRIQGVLLIVTPEEVLLVEIFLSFEHVPTSARHRTVGGAQRRADVA